MKKGMVFLLICFMLVFAAACGETETSQNAQTGTSGEAAQASAETEASQGENSNALIAYFTYAENAELPDGVDASASASIQVADGERTGNTGMVARMIQDAIGADFLIDGGSNCLLLLRAIKAGKNRGEKFLLPGLSRCAIINLVQNRIETLRLWHYGT